MAGGDQGSHVEATADRRSSAENRAFGAQGAAVAIKRGQACQGCSFTPVERAQFRHLCQQKRSGALA